MFHAELISMSRGQSYDQVDILEARHGDFDRYGLTKPFGDRTVAFFYNDKIIMAHPWGIRIIHLDKNPRSGNGAKNFDFERIIIDGDVSYADGTYIDDDYYNDLSIPDLFEDPGEVIDQVTFSCNQGIFITHDANIVSIIRSNQRGNRGVVQSTKLETADHINPLAANAKNGPRTGKITH